MALYENPGTNFHDLNLDWLIGKMKEVLQQWAATEADWAGVQAIIDSLPAAIDAYYSDPEHPREVPTAWTDQAQQLVDAAVQEEAQYREEEDDRLSDEMDEAIAQEVVNRNNAITTAVGQAEQYADAAIAANNTSVVNPIATAVSDEATARAAADTELDGRLDAVEAAVLELNGAVRLYPPNMQNAIHGNFARLDPGSTLDPTSYGENEAWRAYFFPAEPFEIFSVNCMTLATGIACVTFLDANYVVLANLTSTYSTATATWRPGAILYAPRNTAYILVQGNYGTRANQKLVYRGYIPPHSRTMFCQSTTPNITGNPVFKYVRNDYTNEQQQISYPFESFRWALE